MKECNEIRCRCYKSAKYPNNCTVYESDDIENCSLYNAVNKIESQNKYISDLIDHISQLEQTQKELIEYLRLEHQGSSLQDEWIYCHETDKCNTCNLIKSIVGEWNEKAKT